MRFMNSGVNFLRAASTPARAILSEVSSFNSPVLWSAWISDAANPKLGLNMEPISAAPRLLVMKIKVREKSTRRLSRSEERRVGKECRYRRARDSYKKTSK